MFDTYLVAGSINTDYNVRLPVLPVPGETVTGTSFSRAFGGKGANQAVALGRLLAGSGKPVHFAGKRGNDDDGRRAKENLESNGVDTRLVDTAESHTGMALIEIDDEANNRIVVVPGANGCCTPAWAGEIAETMRASLDDPARLCCLLQLEIPLPAVTAIIEALAETGCFIMLDPAPAIPLDSGLWSLIDAVTPNQSETRSFTGIFPDSDRTARSAAEKLRTMGTRAVIIKAGSTGVWYFDEQDEFFCPTFRVNARDTTAAGDVFNAAFAAGLGMDLPVAETLRFANAAAAISVTGDGAQGAMPTFDTVEALLREDPRTVARRL